MQFKKIKLTTAMLMLIPCVIGTSSSLAANAESATFTVRLFNSTSTNQSLHYSVQSEGQRVEEGDLLVGDDHGQSIVINGAKQSDKSSAEVVLTDSVGHIVWKETVSFYDQPAEFYSKTMLLDSHYAVGESVFVPIHTIVYDIRDQMK